MSFLFQSGLAALGLVALEAAVAPAQSYVQTTTTKVEVSKSGDSRVRAPFFRFFQSSPPPAKTTTTTMSQTDEPPLAEGDNDLAPAAAPAPAAPPATAGQAQYVPVPASPIPTTPYGRAPAGAGAYPPGPAIQGPAPAYQPAPPPSLGYQPMPATRPLPLPSAQPMPLPQAQPLQSVQTVHRIPSNIPTPADFAGSFQGMPGQYQVVLLHPVSGQPVTVNFTLPQSRGTYKTRLTARYLEFDSPDHTVGIRFARDGRAVVDQD